jgi:hypothetical protein
MTAMFQPPRPSPAIALASRGYHAVYRLNEVNHCPGCGRTHWLLGRVLAECGFCATALPIAGSEGTASWALGLEVERS